MAACSDSTGTYAAPVILRIKRRRCEDPAEALVMHSAKMPKYLREDDSTTVHDSTVGVSPYQESGESSVFHFVGTLKEGEEPTVFDRVSQEMEIRAKQKPNPFAKLTISVKRENMKMLSKSAGSHFRYKLLTERRATQSGASVDSKTLKGQTMLAADLPGKDHRTNLFISGNKAKTNNTSSSTANKRKEENGVPSSNVKDYVRQMSRLYDLVQEDRTSGDGEESRIPLGSAFEEKVLYNGVEMVRERVTKGISSTAEMTAGNVPAHGVPLDSSDVEYVTDVYYADNCPALDTDSFDWSSLKAVEAPELVNDIFGEDSFDEEDSNDESHPRNDYPEEEDEDECEEEDGDYSGRGSSQEYSDCSSEDDQDAIKLYRNRRHRYQEPCLGGTEDVCNDYESHSPTATASNWYMTNASKLGAVVMHTKSVHDDNDDDEYDSMNDDNAECD